MIKDCLAEYNEHVFTIWSDLLNRGLEKKEFAEEVDRILHQLEQEAEEFRSKHGITPLVVARTYFNTVVFSVLYLRGPFDLINALCPMVVTPNTKFQVVGSLLGSPEETEKES